MNGMKRTNFVNFRFSGLVFESENVTFYTYISHFTQIFHDLICTHFSIDVPKRRKMFQLLKCELTFALHPYPKQETIVCGAVSLEQELKSASKAVAILS